MKTGPFRPFDLFCQRHLPSVSLCIHQRIVRKWFEDEASRSVFSVPSRRACRALTSPRAASGTERLDPRRLEERLLPFHMRRLLVAAGAAVCQKPAGPPELGGPVSSVWPQVRPVIRRGTRYCEGGGLQQPPARWRTGCTHGYPRRTPCSRNGNFCPRLDADFRTEVVSGA